MNLSSVQKSSSKLLLPEDARAQLAGGNAKHACSMPEIHLRSRNRSKNLTTDLRSKQDSLELKAPRRSLAMEDVLEAVHAPRKSHAKQPGNGRRAQFRASVRSSEESQGQEASSATESRILDKLAKLQIKEEMLSNR